MAFLYPFEPQMTEAQHLLYLRRLELERQQVELWKQMRDAKGGCTHVIIKGQVLYSPAKERIVWTHEGYDDDCCSASCAICGQDFGWWCPKSPDHYCHYDKGDYGCDYCGEPDERK
jgi:hypothetical protein